MIIASLSTGLPPAATIIVAIIAALAAYLANKRDRRRALYSEAVKAAVAWVEMLYRVRRRGEGAERGLVDRFHELQDNLTYYEAWVGSESVYMARSYTKLIAGVKKETEKLIRAAWKESIRPIPGDAIEGEGHPNVSPYVDAFLADVRSQLSPWPWAKAKVAKRNKGADGS